MDLKKTSEETAEKLLARRIILIDGKLEPDLMRMVRFGILRLNTESVDDIKLLINSSGGNVTMMNLVFDVIKLSKARVVGIVNGACDSAAVTLLQACHVRLATRGSSFFMHFVSHDGDFFFKSNTPTSKINRKLKTRIESSKKVQRYSENILCQRTGLTRIEIRRYMIDGEENGARLDAEEAKAIGLVDNVIDSFELF
jgi:ATP-dependent protease ClpP protease subunit